MATEFDMGSSTEIIDEEDSNIYGIVRVHVRA